MANVALRTAQRLPKGCRVEWEDGLSAQFSWVWLRDNCDKRPSLLHLDLHAKPENVDCSADRRKLNVVWPPFLNSDYSSNFLREHSRVVLPKCRPVCHTTHKVLNTPWCVLPFAPRSEKGPMAEMVWGEAAMEVGTMWPHMEQVPSKCVVYAETEGAKLHVVDAVSALSRMSHMQPSKFAFLSSAPVEYRGDLFNAIHPVAHIEDGRIVAAVFNNERRSADITVENLDRFYDSLKTFHKICLDTMKTITLDPSSALVIDNTQTFLGAPAQMDRRLHIDIYH